MRLTIVIAAALASVTIAGLAAPARAQVYKQVYSFPGGREGGYPFGGLIKFHGKLFGTTEFGGGSKTCRGGCGTVFSLDPATGKEKTVYVFQGGSDGADPQSSLIVVGDLLYGTTSAGGGGGAGSIFSIDPSTNSEKVVYPFKGGDDGSTPKDSLLKVAGTLYGVTEIGGSKNLGTVFSIDVATGVEKVVYAFQGGADGSYPLGSLIDVKGTLYGTTDSGGGDADAGTVFSINPATGAETILHAFRGKKDVQGNNDGYRPDTGVTEVGRKLYGTTVAGGAQDQGTVFRITPETGIGKVTYSFNTAPYDGNDPSRMINVHGTLYGTTLLDPLLCGTVFAYNVATRTETVVYTFGGGSDGCHPESGLVDVGGTLYGTTYEGGTAYTGTVFAITP